MVQLYSDASFDTSRCITHRYSTSFSSAVSLLHPTIRDDIYGIYGFVRLVDEVVDSFTDYPQKELFTELYTELNRALERGISTNPVVYAFVQVVLHCNIERTLIESFMASMESDLNERKALSEQELSTYIYGSAEVVGLMCLRVFTKYRPTLYDELQESARTLGAAFQKVNFLRDLKTDYIELDRIYFPQFAHATFTNKNKAEIIEQIERDFETAYKGIVRLPNCCKTGVMVAYNYYKELLQRIKETPIETLICQRVRVNNIDKAYLLLRTLCFNRWGSYRPKQNKK